MCILSDNNESKEYDTLFERASRELHLGTSNNAYRVRKQGYSNYLALDEMLS